MKKSPAARVYALAFGAAVVHLRGSRGQVEIARAAGLSQPVLSRIEDGRRLPDAYTAGKLAQALGRNPGGLDLLVEEVLRRAPGVASVVLRREVAPEELADLPGARGLFTFLAALAARAA